MDKRIIFQQGINQLFCGVATKLFFANGAEHYYYVADGKLNYSQHTANDFDINVRKEIRQVYNEPVTVIKE